MELRPELQEDLLKQTNQAAIDIGRKALGSLFLLNGAAATALLAKEAGPVLPALIFAFSALWTVAAMGVSYVFCLALCAAFIGTDVAWPAKKWQKAIILAIGLPDRLDMTEIERWRRRLIIFSLGPAVLFLAGLFVAAVKMG